MIGSIVLIGRNLNRYIIQKLNLLLYGGALFFLLSLGRRKTPQGKEEDGSCEEDEFAHKVS